MAEQAATPAVEHDEEGYSGPATVVLDGEEIDAEVRLESRHEPFDGRIHWSGRVLVNARLTELIGNGSADVELRNGAHSAPAKLSEADMWQRYRVTGVGRPPFALDEPPEPDTD